jgi:uncharacterized membrane protein HdeD (DUF308 family)
MPLPSRGLLVTRGILALVVGIICLAWPGITLGAVVIVFAVLAFVDAVNQIGAMFDRESVGERVWRGLIALFDIAAGVVAIVWPGITILALVLVIGVWAIIAGVTECYIAYQTRGLGRTGWLAAAGVLAIVYGILLFIWPHIGAYVLAVLFGIALVARGVMWLVLAWAAGGTRRAGRMVHA